MLINLAALILIFVNGLSLYGTLVSWRNVRNGKAELDDLRDLTGLMDRKSINHKFGLPDANGFYRSDFVTIKNNCTAMSQWGEATDILLICLLISVFIIHNQPWQYAVLIVVALITVVQWAYAAYLVWRHRDQLDWKD